MASAQLAVRDLGRVAYKDAHELQVELVEARAAGRCPDTLLLCEHEPVITTGRATEGGWQHGVREGPPGLPVHAAERGGQATYHGPGQMVGYPIVHLREAGLGVHAYLRLLETVTIAALSRFGLRGERMDGLTGVWVGGAKIAAIGIAVRRWVSFHGVAVNIHCDLGVYDLFVPCGVRGCHVTSLTEELGRPVCVSDYAETFAGQLRAALTAPQLPAISAL
jgi:lipoate-protein ligase B